MRRPDGVYYRLVEMEGRFGVVEMDEHDEADYHQERIVQGLYFKSEQVAQITAVAFNMSMGQTLDAHLILALAKLVSMEEAP